LKGQISTIILRACAAFLLVALAILSWLPGQYRPRTGVLSGQQEHFLAYLLAGLLTATATRRNADPWWVAVALALYAGLLELGQYFVPGRQPAFADFLASALGAVVGIALSWLVRITR